MTESANRSVDRALEVLETVAHNNEDGFTLSELSVTLEIPKSTLHSILQSLRNHRFLMYNAREQRYFLGEALFNLGNKFTDQSNLLSMVEEVMREVSEQTNYTTFFGVLSGNEVLYLLRYVPVNLQITASPKHGLKAHCTGLGKALIMDHDLDTLVRLFPKGLPKVMKNTITSVDVLHEQIVEMRKRGFAYEVEESSPLIQCISIPIRNEGKIVAAMSVSFPTYVKEEEKRNTIEPALVRAKEAIEQIIARNKEKWIYSQIR